MKDYKEMYQAKCEEALRLRGMLGTLEGALAGAKMDIEKSVIDICLQNKIIDSLNDVIEGQRVELKVFKECARRMH